MSVQVTDDPTAAVKKHQHRQRRRPGFGPTIKPQGNRPGRTGRRQVADGGDVRRVGRNGDAPFAVHGAGFNGGDCLKCRAPGHAHQGQHLRRMRIERVVRLHQSLRSQKTTQILTVMGALAYCQAGRLCPGSSTHETVT
jgi:hypothetical protein